MHGIDSEGVLMGHILGASCVKVRLLTGEGLASQ